MFVQFQNRKWIYFGFQQGLSWLESKNRKNCERKSATSSLDPSIIRFYSSDGGTCVPLACFVRNVIENSFCDIKKILTVF